MAGRTPRELRQRRHSRVRRRANGSTERPRLAVFRSSVHIYVQVIDDSTGRTLAAASTVEKTLAEQATGAKIEQAKVIGAAIAERAKSAGITKVVFDRGGFKYHGRIQALAEAAREAGLDF